MCYWPQKRPERTKSVSFDGVPIFVYPGSRAVVPDVPAAAAAAMSGSIGMGPAVSLSTASSSSMEELQSAIEGAIAHCKNTMGGGVVSLCPRKGVASGEICAF